MKSQTRDVAVVLGVVLSVTLGGAVTAVSPTVAAAEQVLADSAGDAMSASLLAASSGSPVRVGDSTSETQIVYANPDGTYTAEFSAVPQRVLQDGEWVSIDTTLERRADGSVAPRASSSDVVFSGGAAGQPLAVLTTDTGRVTIQAPWALPEPTLSGSAAVYASVIPGVDLVAVASAEGFSQNLVVHNRAATQTPEFEELTFGLGGTSLTPTSSPSGNVAWTDGAGDAAATTGNAVMWEAGSTDSAAAVVEGAPVGSDVEPVPLSVNGGAMELEPSPTFLADPDTQYPVVIDPVTKDLSRNGYTMVWDDEWANRSWWKTDDLLSSGYDGWQDYKRSRAMWRFNTQAVIDKHIISAELRLVEEWAATCAPTEVEAWRIGEIGPNTTWSNQPVWQDKLDTRNVAKGWSSDCPGGEVGFDITAGVRYQAARARDTISIGLRAANENDKYAWKKFRAGGSTLSVRYVTPPQPPGNVEVADPHVACQPRSSAVSFNEIQPRVSAVLRSPDGGGANLRAEFEIVLDDGSLKPHWTSKSILTDGGPTPVSATVPSAHALENNSLYRYRARTLYEFGDNQVLTSGWSDGCWFKVDRFNKKDPVVTSTAFPACGTPEDPELCAQPTRYGQSGLVTFANGGSTDIVKYEYRLDGAAVVTVSTTSGASKTVTLTPLDSGVRTLEVRSKDKAGNASPWVIYQFRVAEGAAPTGIWTLDEAAGSTQAADSTLSPNVPHPLGVSGATWSGKARLGGALDFDGMNDSTTSTTKVVDTANSFAVAAWVRPEDLSRSMVVASQSGAVKDAFQLLYSPTYGWTFSRTTTNTTKQTVVRATFDSTAPMAAKDSWTHLVAVYDKAATKMRLYVNGRQVVSANATFTTPWTATGNLSIGRGQDSGVANSFFDGQIDEVRTWNRPITATEARALANPVDSNGQAVIALAGSWGMEQDGSGKLQDASVYGRALTRSGTTLPATVLDPERGGVLRLVPNESQRAVLTGAAVDTTGSYTVTAWVRSAAYTDPGVIARQEESIGGGPFQLEYAQDEVDGTRMAWRFNALNASGSGGSTCAGAASASTSVCRATDDVADAWTHVTAVYDGLANQVRIYINGAPVSVVDGGTKAFTSPALGTTQFVVGAAFGGDIDDVRVYVGAASDNTVPTLMS